MNVYKFVFVIGLINVTLPFIAIPGVYKQYVYVVTGSIAILYSLILRTIQKEKESGLIKTSEAPNSNVSNQSPTQPAQSNIQADTQATRKIEEVVEMEQTRYPKTSRIKIKRPAIKAKVVSSDNEHHD